MLDCESLESWGLMHLSHQNTLIKFRHSVGIKFPGHPVVIEHQPDKIPWFSSATL